MDSFAGYDNTLGFFVGDNVIGDITNSNVAPYIKAAAVDLKSYRNSNGYREIPVGYSDGYLGTSLDNSLSPYLQNYLACGSDTIDFFGQIQYSWCDPSSFTISGYNTLYANALNYSVPIFFSETGCNLNPPRMFDDQAAIFGPEMNDQWSGAVIYEWESEENDTSGYGLVSYDSSAMTYSLSPDFTALQNQWATLTPTGTPIMGYDIAIITPPACPTYTSTGWLVNGDVKLSTLLEAVSVTSPMSVSRSKTGPTQGAPTSSSGSKAHPLVSNTSAPDGSAKTGISTGAKAAIALGVILIFVVIILAAFLLWRRRRNIPPKGPLNLSAEGLEVGMAPPKQEHDSPSISTEEAHTESHTHASEIGSPIIISAELRNSTPSQPHPDSSISNTAELSAIPATQKVGSASPAKTFASSTPRNAVRSSTASSSWANAPWHPETSPIDAEREAKAQQVPLLTTNEEEDELSRIEAEERRIDAQIAESERIRALNAEKAALQAKKAELLAKRESSAKT
jgi:1,3-beta-glucanosyltransferase GAS1